MKYQWKKSEELTDDKHIVIDTGNKLGCILIEKHVSPLEYLDEDACNLILAASDMLNALKESKVILNVLLDRNNGHWGITNCLEVVNKAIDKAKGI